MINTNAIVEKLKDLGLRHGEKAGVAVASTLFFVCVGMAATKPTIDTTPEKIKSATQASESNLNRPEPRDTIIKNLEEKGIKASNFAKVVDDQVKTALVADDYKAAREWTSPEPGAGLIRDTPVLIAPTELYAYPGRGGLLVYALDENGERIPDTDADKQTDKVSRRRRRRRPNPMMGGMGAMGAMRGVRKKATKSKADREREAQEELNRQRKELQGKLAGSDRGQPEEEKKADQGIKEPPAKEITKGFHWVAVTGVLDHAKMLANYRDALKNPAVAHPNYKRLDVQRKTLQADGSWSNWTNVNSDENLKVLDNLPEEDDELTPESVRPEALVDPLPFLKAGLWEKVHIASLVPLEKKTISEPNAPGTMGGGMLARGGGKFGGGTGMGGMMDAGGMAASMRGMMEGMSGSMSRARGEGMMGGMRGMMGRGMMGGGMMGTATETVANYWKSEEKRVMIRALDFSVEPDTTYRYRVRIVAFNPNLNREDVSPGVDTKSDELKGKWSEPTDEVYMPPDVMPYVKGTLPPSPASDMKAQFQVIRFNPVDGVTVPHNFGASPGEVIGEPRTAEIPVSDGSGKKSKTIDFNSHQIVLDVFANKKPLSGKQLLPPGFTDPPMDRPVIALLLRPDGSVVVHGEADDVANDVRKDIEANYRHEISLSTKKRENSVGMGMMGMMMMGGMGGPMPGGGMGGAMMR
jgi:hypothetical protein